MTTPARPRWQVDPTDATYRCEYRGWVAKVTPDRYMGHPGWEICVWLRGHKPDSPGSQTDRDHFSSGVADGLDRRSLIWALQHAAGMLDLKAKDGAVE